MITQSKMKILPLKMKILPLKMKILRSKMKILPLKTMILPLKITNFVTGDRSLPSEPAAQTEKDTENGVALQVA